MADDDPDKTPDIHVRSEHAPPSRPDRDDGVMQPIRPTTPVNPPVVPPTDADLTRQVEDALVADGRLHTDDITVMVAAGVVELAGAVELEFHRTLATALAQSVPGVLNINNLLDVRET